MSPETLDEDRDLLEELRASLRLLGGDPADLAAAVGAWWRRAVRGGP